MTSSLPSCRKAYRTNASRPFRHREHRVSPMPHARRVRRLAAKRVREVLAYNSRTGGFHWRVRRGNSRAGVEAGTWHGQGYRTIQVDGVLCYAHHLAWLHFYGKHPRGIIDHINRKRGDNRIANLRQCPRGHNAQNAVTRNPSGFKGVYRHRSKWQARIRVNRKTIYLGTFDTPQKAAAAYDKAARRYYGRFARTNAGRAA